MNAVQSCADLHFWRIEIDLKKLKKQLILFITPVVTYLIVWTVLDMPGPIESLTLDNSGDQNIVHLDRSCSSASRIWKIISYALQFLLLLSSSVLAFQSRGVVDQIKEIKFIGFLVYSHLMFLIFRVVIWRLSLNGSIPGTEGSSIESICLSVDVLIGTVIYFGPKFYDIISENNKSSSYQSSGLAGAANRASSDLSGVSRLRQSRVSVIIKKPPSGQLGLLPNSSESSEILPCSLDDSKDHPNPPGQSSGFLKSSFKSNTSASPELLPWALEDNKNHPNTGKKVTFTNKTHKKE